MSSVPTEPIRTPFGFESTTEDVLAGVDLRGKRVIVTGASSGIGVETARALAGAGAEVTLAVRNTDAGERVAEEIRSEAGSDLVAVRRLDLADQASVRTFVEAWGGPLHILVNNAGIMALPELERTAEGWEMQFATNFMGHFALTVGLHDALRDANGSRVVSLSSSGMLFSPVVFDDLHFRFREYSPLAAYAQSKTANALLAVAVTRHWAEEGIYSNACNPGAIATNLQRHTGGLKTPPEFHKTVRQGAATSVLLAGSPLLEGVGGRYFEDCNESPVVDERPTDFSPAVAPYAIDLDNAERLWAVASGLLRDAEV